MSSSSVIASQISQRRKTALAAIQGFDNWDIEEIMAVRSPNCIVEILPKSLNRPPMDNEAYRAYFGVIMPYFRDFKVVINDIIEDEKGNKIAIWAKSTAVTDIGPYANEYMLVFHFNEAGDKLERFLEFVDSSNSTGYLGELRKYIAEKEGKK